MRSKWIIGLFGILLLALVACQRQEMQQAPAAPPAPSPAPAVAPAPAPSPAPAPAPQAASAASGKGAKAEVTRDKVLYPTQKGEEPVPTESKFEGKEDSFIASVECGVQEDRATVSVTVQNPTQESLKLGDRPQVFDNGAEMIGLRLNSRYVLDYLECKDYDPEAGLAPGGKAMCSATVPPDANTEKVLLRHAPTSLGNPSNNNLVVYSPSGGREQVQFTC